MRIRLAQAACLSAVISLVGRRIVDRAEPEKGLEGGHRGASSVVAEDELVEVDGQVLAWRRLDGCRASTL